MNSTRFSRTKNFLLPCSALNLASVSNCTKKKENNIIIIFKFYCIYALFKTNSDVIIVSRVFQRALGQCQEGWLFWIVETTSKDGQEGWLNINIVIEEFPETPLTVGPFTFV